MAFVRIYAVIKKELRQLSRDAMTFAMIVAIPLVQLVLFGYAINTDVRNIPAAVVNESNSHYSRQFVDHIVNTQVVTRTLNFLTVKEAEAAMTRGEVKAILYLPKDFDRRLFSHPMFNPHAEITQARPVGQWIVNGSDTLVAAAMNALKNMPIDPLNEAPRADIPSTLEMVNYYNPEQRTAVNIVPGLLVIILTMTMVMFTAAAIVREREQGNMEFLINTPVRPMELMLGKVVPYVFVGLLQAFIILWMGHLLFSVPIHGGIVDVFVVTLLFIFASLTMGLIISTLTHTQLQAMQMAVFVLLPSILLSGFMFPYETMPTPAQWVAELFPATHFMRLLHAIVLRGAELSQLLTDALWLAGFTALGLLVAAARFHKRLD